MYSYEDRVRAVELYLKLGKRVKATIRQLGYPTKNSLKAWCEEFEKSGDLQKEYVRVKPKYSEEQKNLALEHYVNHGRSFSFTLRALGYPCRQILTAWVRERYPETRKRVVGKVGRHGRVIGDQAARGVRTVHTGRKCTGGGAKAGRRQGVAVQLEEPVTRPRGPCIHEARQGITIRDGSGRTGAAGRRAPARHSQSEA